MTAEKFVIRLLLLPCLLILFPILAVIGFGSISRLGRVMRKTGDNLAEYEW